MSNTSTSSRMKELKDLKEADTQRSPSMIPPFLQPSLSTAANHSRLSNVNPLILVFDGPLSNQCTKTLNIANISNDRIAWRVLCNAPTRYVVSPNKGFLFKQEKIAVRYVLSYFCCAVLFI
ncbi:MSP domain protein [Oesophagostomum dentatum]|uniref:Major sperm protein n=1 Tax=Oesophagostomum dentatum TaxID=61180 RepID=A0A0B1RZ38_OESDE|nr:MSP domain protein [Oesophagostomum dentatum]